MPRKNRGYKRGEPHRDATLFVIACEGAVREKEYFEHLGKYTTRLRIRVLENKDRNSAPKWVLESGAKYVDEVGLAGTDQLWFVMDTDRWPEEQLRAIHEACEAARNWYMALSNPCFEVWLYMHVDNINSSNSTDCGGLKGELPRKIQNGYSKEKFIPLIGNAHAQSMALDKDPDHFMPERMRTKLHLLSSEILRILGAAHSFDLAQEE